MKCFKIEAEDKKRFAVQVCDATMLTGYLLPVTKKISTLKGFTLNK